MAEYEEAQAIVADFDEQARASHAVASMEVEDEDGNVEEQTITFADYQKALEVEEPDSVRRHVGPVDVPGLGRHHRRCHGSGQTSRRGCSPSSMDGIVSGVGAVIGFIPADGHPVPAARASSEACGYLSASRSSWTASSASFGLSGKIVHPDAHRFRLRRARRHVHEDHRERDGPSHDHHDDHDDPVRREDAHHRTPERRTRAR